MPKIKYCTPDFLTEYKADFETKYLPLYLAGDKEAILKTFDTPYVMEGNLSFEYRPLMTPQEADGDSAKYVTENSKRLYLMLKGLSPSQATHEELWFTMIHMYYLDYLFAYVKSVEDAKDVSRKIQNAIFFLAGNIRALVINHLSRYWWIGYRTYDAKNATDPFWLTDFYAQDNPSGKSVVFFSSKFTNNHEFGLGIIEGIKEVSAAGEIRSKKETYTFVNEHFNYVGGVRVLDIMTREQVKAETKAVLADLLAGKIEVTLEKRKNILALNSKYL